jgi:hypothetical protein
MPASSKLLKLLETWLTRASAPRVLRFWLHDMLEWELLSEVSR